MTKINTESMKTQYERQLDTFTRKNSDYGNSFELGLETYGEVSALVRMEDKMLRLRNLVSSGKRGLVDSESVIDTLEDLSNYSAMTACYLRSKNGVSTKEIPTLISDRTLNSVVDSVDKPLPRITNVKGLENGYFIRHNVNVKNKTRYSLAFNPEGTVRTESDKNLPYVIECFGNSYDGMTGWSIHVFNTLEDMVGALNFDNQVQHGHNSFGTLLKTLDIKYETYKPEQSKCVTNVWKRKFYPAFEHNMKCKDLSKEGLHGGFQGLKVFNLLFISKKTGTLIVKGSLLKNYTNESHKFIWFSDTKDVLLEDENVVPIFNDQGILYDANSNGKIGKTNERFKYLEHEILSKLKKLDWTNIRDMVFLNDDEENLVGYSGVKILDDERRIEKITVLTDGKKGKTNKYELDFSDKGYMLRNRRKEHDTYTLAILPDTTISFGSEIGGPEYNIVIERNSSDLTDEVLYTVYLYKTKSDMFMTLNRDYLFKPMDYMNGLVESVNYYAEYHAVYEIPNMLYGDTAERIIEAIDKKYPGFKHNIDVNIGNDDYIFNNHCSIMVFDMCLISNKTGCDVISGVVNSSESVRRSKFIWFSDTKEVLLEYKHMCPTFNNEGVMVGLLVKNDENPSKNENYVKFHRAIYEGIYEKKSVFMPNELKIHDKI